MVKQYRKKPVVISAVQWTGENFDEVRSFMKGNGWERMGDVMRIHTLEGKMRADKGDYIIKGVNGELYPCKPDIFEKTYEEV